MKDNFSLFENVNDDEMSEIYKDVIGSRELGIRPMSLDKHVKLLKEHFSFQTFGEGIEMTQKYFFDEVAKRYFKKDIGI